MGYWLGCAAEPANGLYVSSSNYSYIHPQTQATEAGLVTKIEVFEDTNADGIKFAVLSKDGSEFTDKYRTGVLDDDNQGSVSVYEAPADFIAMPIAVGDYIGFYSLNDKVDVKASGGHGYWWDIGDSMGDDDADTFYFTDNTRELQFRFWVETEGEEEEEDQFRLFGIIGQGVVPFLRQV